MSRALDEPVVVVPYDAAWPDGFEAERAALEPVLAPADPETAAEYETPKRRLAVAFRTDREAYTDAKEDFVRAVLARARGGRERRSAPACCARS